MTIAWFLCPYKRGNPTPWGASRYCAMNDFTAQIRADGGSWSEAECLGDHAVVKVNASDATLTTINAATGFIRIPVSRLSDPLSSLTVAQRNAITTKLQNLGYTLQEIRDALGNDIRQRTLLELLRFVLSRRRRPRYDAGTDSIILDGDILTCKPIELVDAEVQ